MQVPRWLLCFVIPTLLLGAESTKPPNSRPRRNIILITLDTTRADRMGFLGSPRGLSPNLDALARQSVVFARAYAQVPLTTPSHAAILTGTYPQFNHLSDLGMPLEKDLPYLPDLLHRSGYRTAAFVGAMMLDPKGLAASGFDRGFETYDAGFHKRGAGEDRYRSMERRAGDVVDRALRWLRAKPSSDPFFLWVHVYDPHDPYDPPEPYKTRYASAPYDGEIAYTDSAMGKFLAGLRADGLYENALIAVMADHGEAFGEHGEERHGVLLYDETVHVPLLLRFPRGRFAGRRVEGGVRLVDVAPTILREVGVAIPKAMQGEALQPMAMPEKARTTGTDAVGRPAYAETDYANRAFGWSPLQAWRDGKYLYVQAPNRELYDQAVDPFAERNVATVNGAVADTMASNLREFHSRTTSHGSRTQAQLDPAQAEQLRALGYLASDSNSSAGNGNVTSVNPRDKIAIANLLHQALVDTEIDDYNDAIPKLERVIRDEPQAHAAYLELGRSWIHEKEYQKALPVLHKAVELAPESGIAHYELGLALVKTGQWEAARPEFEAAVTRAPMSADLHFYLGAVHARLKHVSEAAKEFETTLRLEPSHYQANLVYGHMLVLEHDPDAALPKLRRAAKAQPESGEPHKYLADAYTQLGQTANASRERELAERLKGPVNP
jgi:choline-sulfatase